MLDGKKTYITAVVLALSSFALAMGWLSKEQYEVIIGLLGSLGLAALRSGMGQGATVNSQDGASAAEAKSAPGSGVGAEG
jgi:hypothetical protein